VCGVAVGPGGAGTGGVVMWCGGGVGGGACADVYARYGTKELFVGIRATAV